MTLTMLADYLRRLCQRLLLVHHCIAEEVPVEVAMVDGPLEGKNPVLVGIFVEDPLSRFDQRESQRAVVPGEDVWMEH